MSSVRSIGGGLMVVTKIVPIEDESQVPMTNVVSPQFNRRTTQYEKVPEKVPEMTRLFLKGYPLQLGIVQIFLGLMTLALGVLTLISPILFGEIPLCLGVFFIISGSLSVAGHKGQNVCLIKGALAMNIISSLLALPAIGYICWELSKQIYEECYGNGDDYPSRYNYWDCYRSIWQYNAGVNGLKGLLLVMAVFEFCVSTTIAVFSAKAIRHESANQQVGACTAGGTTGATEGTSALPTEEDDAPLISP